jgi:transposase
MSQRYRLYPTPAQEQVMRMHCDHARFVWNLALEQNEHARKLGRYADQKAWDRQLAEARRGTWLGDGSSSVQQAALRDLRQAFRNWWSNPGHFGAPSWRSVKAGSQGFVVRDVRVSKLNRKWAELIVPKAGRVRFRLSRPLGEHGHARVTLDRSGRWHVSFSAPQPAVERVATGAVVGVDRGVTDSVALSDGRLLRCPGLNEKERARKRRLQRKMARQIVGSNRREVTHRAIAKLAAREADRRKDWVEKTSTQLVRDYDLIVFEDLKVAQMMRSARGTIDAPGTNVAQKRGLNRGIAAQGWSMLRTRTEQKVAASVSCDTVGVHPHGTSQRCSCCGKIGDRRGKVFICRPCQRTVDADVNAAENIRAAGLAVLGRGGNGAIGPPDEASTPELVGAA